MRVLHVIPSLAAADGGPTTVVKELASVARERGDMFRIATTDKGLQRQDPREPEATYAKAIPPSRWTFSPQLAIQVWKALPRVDVVHIHSVHTFTTLAGAVMSFIRHRPYVIEPHGALGEYHMRQRRLLKTLYFACVDRPILRTAKAVIVSSRAEYLSTTTRLPSLRVSIIPLGVDEHLFDIRPGGRASTTAVFIGRLAEVKGVDLLLEAWPTVVSQLPDAQLILAGPLHRDLPVPIREAVRRLHGNGVRWVGPVDQKVRNELLRTCKVFVLPSRHESFGIAVAEAMAAAVPVIVTSSVGISSEVTGSGAGYVVPPDGESLALALVEALSADTAALGESARRTAAEEFRWTKVYDRLLGVYRSAAISMNR